MSMVRRFLVAAMCMSIPAACLADGGVMAKKVNTLRITGEGRFDALGNMTMTVKCVYPSELAYTMVKSDVPNPYVMARRFLGASARLENENIKVSYDDSQRCLDVSCKVLGAAIWRNNRWESTLAKGDELIFCDAQRAIFLMVGTPGSGSFMVETDTYIAPPGATDLKYDRKGVLSYALPMTPAAGSPDLEVTVNAKPRIMSAVYKIYGNTDFAGGRFWAAKTVFKNNGKGDVKNLRVSYKLGDYTSWSTPVSYPLLPPGGAIVDCYYPVLQSKIAELTMATPQDLECKYSFVDDKGQTVEETAVQRLEVLGRSQMVFSDIPREDQRAGEFIDWHANDPLWAVFVTRMDGPVREFAGLASRRSGGVAAAGSDEEAIRFCKALYDLEAGNGISYQTPAGDDARVDANLVQEVKYPRDVLRDKSGTCVDLAILFASVCESVGLKVALISITGHVYPVIYLPKSGRPYAIETTAVGGAAVGGAYAFSVAEAIGAKRLSELRPGQYSWVDVEEWRQNGVIGPELSPLPAGVVTKDWGYREDVKSPVRMPKQDNEPEAQQGGAVGFRGSYTMQGYNQEMPLDMAMVQNQTAVSGKMSLNDGVLQGAFAGSLNGEAFQVTAELKNQNTGMVLGVRFAGGLQGKTISGRWQNTMNESGQFRVTRVDQ